jgi:hypothetical protein
MAPEDLRDTLTGQVEALEAALARVTAERDWLGRQVKALAAERERVAVALEDVIALARTALDPLKSGAT